MQPRSVARRLGRLVAGAAVAGWRPGSRLFVVGDGAGWSIEHDVRHVSRAARLAGARVADPRLLTVSRGQGAFYASQFELLGAEWRPPPHRLATAYFHGRPGTPGMPEFDACYQALRTHREQLERVQVTHAEMRELVLEAGVAPERVHLIRIGVDLPLFPLRTPADRAAVRAQLGLPETAFVVGSFQKDGVGSGAGLEPKLIKGPDVLVDALALLRARVPELHVLLSGPARGYVQRRLDELSIPWAHRYLERYEDLPALYAALDAYAVASRQEGGPKAVLEAMARGVPLVSTRVGQAPDLVRDGENGWLVDVGDAGALADRLEAVALAGSFASSVAAARSTAEENAYEAQTPLWRSFFDGFVELA
jgi:glycosyltransferase involved in cell wall biosynthesis